MKSDELALPADVFADLELADGDQIAGTAQGGFIQIRVLRRAKDVVGNAPLTNAELLELAKKHTPPQSFFDEEQERPW